MVYVKIVNFKKSQLSLFVLNKTENEELFIFKTIMANSRGSGSL